jgi:hypothetical protein
VSINRLFSQLLIVAVVGVLALTIRESAATSAVVQQAQEAQRIQRIRDAEAERWLAMGKFYEGEASLTGSELRNPLTKPLTSYDAAEAMAYRWQAMAMFYLRHQGMGSGSQLPKPLTTYDAEEASAYRWQAIGDYYLQERFARIR